MMMDVVEANWLVFALVLAVAIAVAWWLFARASTPRERSYRPDVLDEGQGPAQRNQALIDAPPAAQIITPAPHATTLAGVGEVVAVAAQDEVEALPAAQPVAAPAPPAGPEPDPETAPEAPAAPAAGPGDDLSRIKGLGPKLQALLPSLGITTFAQIAALDDAALAELDGKLGAFAGRPKKDNWVAQAKFLAAGDTAGFEAQFGKL